MQAKQPLRKVVPIIVAAGILAATMALGSSASGVGVSPPSTLERGESVPVETQDSSPPVELGEETAISDIEIQQFAEDDGLSFEEARTRLQWQRQIPAVQERAMSVLGDAYGGLWVDPEDGHRLKVGVAWADNSELRRQQEPNAERSRIVAGLAYPDAVDLVAVKFSRTELDEAMLWLADRSLQVQRDGGDPPTFRLEPADNRIYILTSQTEIERGGSPPVYDQARSQFSDMIELRVEENRGEITGLAGCVYPACDPPLRAGARNLMPAGQPCTAAFLARDKTNNSLQQITAGHCTFGHTGRDIRYLTRSGYEDVGPIVRAEWNTASDSAAYRVDANAFWQAQSWVFVTSGPSTTPNTQYPIFSDGDPIDNQRICLTGSAVFPTQTLTNCGEVTGFSGPQQYCVDSPTGTQCRTTNNLIETDMCAKGGDSGAPAYALNRAHGIVVAGDGQCLTLINRISVVENRMNLNITRFQG